MTSRINRTEQIIVLVLTCLILMGSGFRLWVRPDDLVVEVDPVLWAEEFGENRQQGEGHQGEVEGSTDSRRERPAEAVLGGGGILHRDSKARVRFWKGLPIQTNSSLTSTLLRRSAAVAAGDWAGSGGTDYRIPQGVRSLH